MYKELIEKIKELGVSSVAQISVSDIVFEPEFRSLCESNSCGRYGTTWACPPHAGDALELIEKAKTYQTAIVYQTISSLEDSFDIEGMQEASQRHNDITRVVTTLAQEAEVNHLNLGAGGCRHCKRCAVLDDAPCYFPEKKVEAMDAYCVYVTKMAETSGMNYINGKDTVTYFSVLLIKEA